LIGRWFWRLIAWSTDAVNQAKLDQELLKAIQYNKLGLVKRLHAEGASVNCRNEESRSPLYLSVYSDWDRISHFLIDMGADLNAKGKFGGTPLHMAAFKGNLAIVQLMLKKGGDLRAKDSNGNLPIHLAAMYGWADIVEVFVRAVAPERWPLPPLIPGKAEDNEPAEELAARWSKARGAGSDAHTVGEVAGAYVEVEEHANEPKALLAALEGARVRGATSPWSVHLASTWAKIHKRLPGGSDELR